MESSGEVTTQMLSDCIQSLVLTEHRATELQLWPASAAWSDPGNSDPAQIGSARAVLQPARVTHLF